MLALALATVTCLCGTISAVEPPSQPTADPIAAEVAPATYVGVAKVTAKPVATEAGVVYEVTYQTGQVSRVDEATFDRTFLRLDPDGLIDKSVVDSFVANVNPQTVGNRSVVVTTSTITGFDVVTKSDCAETYAFSVEPATIAATRKGSTAIWQHLGFVVHWANCGLNHKPASVDVPTDESGTVTE